MTRYTRSIVGTVAGLLMLSIGAPAKAQSNLETAVIPFAFTVGHTSLPAGTYEVSYLNQSPDVILVRSMFHSAFVIANEAGEGNATEMPQLVFDRIGDHYFLRDIRFVEGVDRNLPEPRAERRALDQRADRSAGNADKVALALGLR